MKLKIEIKDVYGKRTFYPACECSKIITEQLLKQKTLTAENIKALQRTGYEFEISAALTLEDL